MGEVYTIIYLMGSAFLVGFSFAAGFMLAILLVTGIMYYCGDSDPDNLP